MSDDNGGAQQGINYKLVNALVILGIVCMLGFILFWMVPQAKQNADNAGAVQKERATEAVAAAKKAAYDANPDKPWIEAAKEFASSPEVIGDAYVVSTRVENPGSVDLRYVFLTYQLHDGSTSTVKIKALRNDIGTFSCENKGSSN